MATAYAAVGRVDDALGTLEHGYEERDTTVWALRLLEPDWFWDEARFEALRARIGIMPCRA